MIYHPEGLWLGCSTETGCSQILVETIHKLILVNEKMRYTKESIWYTPPPKIESPRYVRVLVTGAEPQSHVEQ